MEQIVGKSLSSEAFERVVEAIISGKFEPGQKISEADLARRLGISRGPVREALHRLEGRLVSRMPRIGVRVIDFGARELRQLFYLREAMEGMAARLAAEFATDALIAELEVMLERHATEIARSGQIAYQQPTQDEDFHFAIARASQCENIEKLLLSEVYYQLRIHRLRSSKQPGRAKQALEEHFDILHELKRRNPEGAEAAMRAHVRAAWQSSLAAVSLNRSEEQERDSDVTCTE